MTRRTNNTAVKRGICGLAALFIIGFSVNSSALGTVHVSSPSQDANLYFPVDTNTWASQQYSTGCSAVSPVIHPFGTRIYTANACILSADYLTIYDLTFEPPVQVASLLQSGRIWGIDINPSGSKVYLADFSANQVAIIDTATNSYDTPIAVSAGPYGIKLTPDGTKAWVTHFSAGTVSVVNLTTGAVEGAPVATGAGASQVAFSPDGNTAFISNSKSTTVTAMSTAAPVANGFKTLQVGSAPNGIEMLPNGEKAYVAVKTSNQVVVISTVPGSCLEALDTPPCVSKQIAVGTAPQDVAITADGALVYVSNSGSESLSVIDTTTDTVTTTIALDTTPNSQPYGIAINAEADGDNDGFNFRQDNCPGIANPGQENFDGDRQGDACDADDDNDGQTDADEAACGSDPLNAADLSPDMDGDNIPDCVDPDIDGDGVANDAPDNCPNTPNPDQADTDFNGVGNACDPVHLFGNSFED